MLKPFLTKSPDIILASFNIDGGKIKNFDTVKKFGGLKEGTAVEKCSNLFPRIDIKKELEEIEKLTAKKEEEKVTKMEEKTEKTKILEVSIEDFAKLQLKVALVTECEKVEKSDKLLKLSVKLGDETRTVVSGIAKQFTPQEMVGKKVVMIANLKPVKLRGIESQGMILCAENKEGKLSLITPQTDIEDGSDIF